MKSHLFKESIHPSVNHLISEHGEDVPLVWVCAPLPEGIGLSNPAGPSARAENGVTEGCPQP